MWMFLCILAALPVLAVLAMDGRRHHPGLGELGKWSYAHRGLYDDEKPENSLPAFQAAVDRGYGAELDVHLLKDGNLAVLHDSDLLRMTGKVGKLEDLTTADLKDCHLKGTAETIPEFSQVLEVFSGKAPLIIELKPTWDNVSALCEAACAAMEGYPGFWCMESFHPGVVLWLRHHRPDILRGQLTEDYFRSDTGLPVPAICKWWMKHQLLNFLTRPDFVAYRFSDRKTLSNTIVRKLWHIQGVTWTVQTVEDFQTAKNENWVPIFEHFRP